MLAQQRRRLVFTYRQLQPQTAYQLLPFRTGEPEYFLLLGARDTATTSNEGSRQLMLSARCGAVSSLDDMAGGGKLLVGRVDW